MDDLIENASFKSLSFEGLYEQEEEEREEEEEEKEEEQVDNTSECIFVRWIKPIIIRRILFVSKDVLLIFVGKTFIFYNIRTQKEDILVVGGSKTTPAGSEILPLDFDGIGCIDCNSSIDLLALGEITPYSKLAICRYPELKMLALLIDNDNSASYKSVLFLRLEYLIGLRNYPAFDLIIWAWRIQEKLFVINTGFIQPNQILNLSTNGRDIYLSQTERDVKCKLQLWTIYISSKTVYADKTHVDLPCNVVVESGCWVPSGWFVFSDASTNVYRTQSTTPNPELCIESTENYNSGQCPLLCPNKQGFIMYTVGNLTCFKDVKGLFTKLWTIAINHVLKYIAINDVETDIYGWSNRGVLIELTSKKEPLIKEYGIYVRYFTFIKPTDETMATINDKNILQVWDVATGEFKNQIKLNGIVTNLCSNPYYCYIAISFKCGKIELVRNNPKVNVLEFITKLVLCDEELSSVNFLLNGIECVVTGFPTGRFYYVSIKLGQMCSVIRKYQSGKQVVDIEICDKNNTSFIVVLYKNEKFPEMLGNNIIIYDINFNTVFELNNSQFYYTSIFKWISYDYEPYVLNLACTIMLSKYIQLMTINVLHAKMLDSTHMLLDHNLRGVKVSPGKNHYVTFGHDGSYNLYEFDEDGQWKKIITVGCSYWQTGGLRAAQVDVNAQNILTLSHRYNFLCTSFNKTCDHNRRFYEVDTPIIVDNIKTEGIGFENAPGYPKRMTWEMINDKNELDASKVKYQKHTNYIIQEFEQIKKELLTLLEYNINGPENTKVNIEEFNLNMDYRLEFKEKCKIERHEYESKIIIDINKLKVDTNNIIKEHWESLFVKPRSIYSLKKLFKVENYPISILDQEVIKKAGEIIDHRILIKDEEEHLSNIDNMLLSKDYFGIFDDETTDSADRQSNDQILSGSTSYRFVDIIEHMNFQYKYYELNTENTANDEIILLKFMVNKLKHSFNKLFDDMFTEKQRQLNILKGYNDRLREIEMEFILACKIQPTDLSPVDYEWNQNEKTEQLIRVEDHEVQLFNTLNNDMLNKMALDKEQNAQLTDLEKFRRQALINMMDGVLEKRWEDELKKDVPKPQCMLIKKPENYTEEDIKTIRQYDDLVVFKNSERIRYKEILEEERGKIFRYINASIEEFDEKIFNLFQTKLKYNSAINQEYLKIIRLSKMLCDSQQRRQQIQIFEENNVEIKKNIDEITKQIAKTEATQNILANTIESLNYKHNVLNKRFKSEFPSKLIYEQALIAYNRRPKVLAGKTFSPLIGYQFVNTIMDPSEDKLDILCAEFVKYLDVLRIYDDFKYVDDYKLNMDRETWQKVCNHRRIKIESEFKISTYQKDVLDKGNLIEDLIHKREEKEIMIDKLIFSIRKLENQDSNYEEDPEFQLIIKQGYAEINLSGHKEDFHNTTLIAKSYIEDVNSEIKQMGKSKIDMLSNLIAFKRKCRLLKWEHVVLKKHKIKLYKYRYDVITSMKITHNIIHYLKLKAKGLNIAKEAEKKVEKELSGIEVSYKRENDELKKREADLIKKIESIKKANEKIDISVDQMNIQLSESKKKIDYSLSNRLRLIRDMRMKNIVKRAQMITNIHDLHKQIKVLETELELLLMKTFPTLYTIPKSTSKKKY